MNGIGSVVDAVKKEGTSTLMKAGIGTAAVIAGSAGATLIPNVTMLEKVPGVGLYLSKSAPGLGLIIASGVLAWNVKDEKAQVAALGLAIAGTIDIIRRNGVLAMINQKFQTGLSGVKGVSGVRGMRGPYPASMQLQGSRTVDVPHRVMSSQLLQ